MASLKKLIILPLLLLLLVCSSSGAQLKRKKLGHVRSFPCSKACTCYPDLFIINCQGAGLKSLPRDLPTGKMMILNLRDNLFKTLEIELEDWPDLQLIDLRGNLWLNCTWLAQQNWGTHVQSWCDFDSKGSGDVLEFIPTSPAPTLPRRETVKFGGPIRIPHPHDTKPSKTKDNPRARLAPTPSVDPYDEWFDYDQKEDSRKIQNGGDRQSNKQTTTEDPLDVWFGESNNNNRDRKNEDREDSFEEWFESNPNKDRNRKDEDDAYVGLLGSSSEDRNRKAEADAYEALLGSNSNKDRNSKAEDDAYEALLGSNSKDRNRKVEDDAYEALLGSNSKDRNRKAEDKAYEALLGSNSKDRNRKAEDDAYEALLGSNAKDRNRKAEDDAYEALLGSNSKDRSNRDRQTNRQASAQVGRAKNDNNQSLRSSKKGFCKDCIISGIIGAAIVLVVGGIVFFVAVVTRNIIKSRRKIGRRQIFLGSPNSLTMSRRSTEASLYDEEEERLTNERDTSLQ